MTNASPAADRSSPAGHDRRSPIVRALGFLGHRWPTALGLLAMAGSVLDMEDGRGQAVVVFLAALIYLGTALTGRPGVVWTLFGASLVAVTALKVAGADPWPAMIGGAVTTLVIALVSDPPRRSRLNVAQIPAMLVFGGAAVAALSLSPVVGSLIVAAALVGHATLDIVVWRAREVVARSLAEFCAVLDLTLGIAIIALQLT